MDDDRALRRLAAEVLPDREDRAVAVDGRRRQTAPADAGGDSGLVPAARAPTPGARDVMPSAGLDPADGGDLAGEDAREVVDGRGRPDALGGHPLPAPAVVGDDDPFAAVAGPDKPYLLADHGADPPCDVVGQPAPRHRRPRGVALLEDGQPVPGSAPAEHDCAAGRGDDVDEVAVVPAGARLAEYIAMVEVRDLLPPLAVPAVEGARDLILASAVSVPPEGEGLALVRDLDGRQDDVVVEVEPRFEDLPGAAGAVPEDWAVLLRAGVDPPADRPDVVRGASGDRGDDRAGAPGARESGRLARPALAHLDPRCVRPAPRRRADRERGLAEGRDVAHRDALPLRPMRRHRSPVGSSLAGRG